MEIQDILDSLGLDLTNPEVKRGAIEAIEAILESRAPIDSLGGIGGGMSGQEIDVELDPDLIQPSKKQPQSHDTPEDIEISDEDDVLSQMKRNNSEEEPIDSNSTGSDQSSSAGDADNSSSSESSDGEQDAKPSDAKTKSSDDSSSDEGSTGNDDTSNNDGISSADKSDNTSVDLDTDGTEDADEGDIETSEAEPADGNAGEESEVQEDETPGDLEELDIDEEDLLDDELKATYDDKDIKTKHEARKIKRERTLAAAKKALSDAQARGVSKALIHELEQSIAALESLKEAAEKSIHDISDDEFNLMINRVFDAISAVGDTSLTFKSEEERKIQAKEIKTDLESDDTKRELSAEDIAQIRAETQATKAREREVDQYRKKASNSFKGFQDFLTSLYRAIALQVQTEEANDDSWSAINRRYSGSGVLQPGKKLNELPNKKVPIIDFYFDQSSSWNSHDIEIGKEAVQALADLEEKGQIKINIYYFSDDVFTDAASARAMGGTSGWNAIVKNVITTQATNVVIMTDGDMEDWWVGDKALTYTVPGYVWYLWKRGINAPRLPRDLKGRGGTQQFSFS